MSLMTNLAKKVVGLICAKLKSIPRPFFWGGGIKRSKRNALILKPKKLLELHLGQVIQEWTS